PDAGDSGHPGVGAIGLCIEKIEFEFCRHYDPELHRAQRLGCEFEHVTGVGEKRFPGSCVETEERLCAWPFGPWNRREAARHYPRIHIRVAVVRSEPDAGNDVAQDVEKHGSARDAKAAAERLVELAAAYAFAAVYAGEVRDQQLHDVGVRELFEERTQFGVASDAAASCHAFR